MESMSSQFLRRLTYRGAYEPELSRRPELRRGVAQGIFLDNG